VSAQQEVRGKRGKGGKRGKSRRRCVTELNEKRRTKTGGNVNSELQKEVEILSGGK